MRKRTMFLFSPEGKYLVEAIHDHKDLALGFVWNRTYKSLVGHVDDSLILQDLSKFTER